MSQSARLEVWMEKVMMRIEGRKVKKQASEALVCMWCEDWGLKCMIGPGEKKLNR